MRDWTRFCRTKELEVVAPDIWVTFPSGRKQRVRVHEGEGVYRLVSTALGRRAVERLLLDGGDEAEKRLAIRILKRNRSAPLVGFRLTARGKLIAESHVAAVGVDREEFRLHLRCVAREADRLELLLTGEDRN